MVTKQGHGLVLGLALALVGCGDATEVEEVPDCPQASDTGCALALGTYETDFVERAGGTCGALESTRGVAAGERATKFGGQCSGDIEWSDDFCMASFEARCPVEERGSGFYNRQVSSTTYSMDALSRTGVLELEIFEADGTLFCTSTYDSETRNVSCGK